LLPQPAPSSPAASPEQWCLSQFASRDAVEACGEAESFAALLAEARLRGEEEAFVAVFEGTRPEAQPNRTADRKPEDSTQSPSPVIGEHTRPGGRGAGTKRADRPRGLPRELRDDFEPLPGEIVASGTNSAEPANEKLHVQRMAISSDRQAGVRFYFNYRNHTGEISFDEKSPDEVRSALKENGYQWKSEATVWSIPIRFEQREQDRLHAKKLFHQVATLIRKEKGIEAPSRPLPD
jgi:hypothetical protein